MKVCVFITHPSQFDVPVFRLGKEFIHVVFTDQRLCDLNFDPELDRNVKWESNMFSGFSFEFLPMNNVFINLWRILKRGNYDLVITSGYYRWDYILSIILSFFLSKKNAIRIDSVDFNNFGFKKFARKFIVNLINLFVDYFFVVGSLSKRYLVNSGVKISKIKFFGYITNTEFFKNESVISQSDRIALLKRWNISESKKIVLCVSKHIEREAPFDSINAFSLLQNDNAQLILVGDGKLNEELKKLACDLNIVNITFIGYVEYRLLPLFYAISSVFVHDSRDEPWGVSVQEAIACNLPVIASNKVGAGYDLIKEGRNGFTYNVGDFSDLSSKIRKAIVLDNNEITFVNDEILEYWKYETIISDIKSCGN